MDSQSRILRAIAPPKVGGRAREGVLDGPQARGQDVLLSSAPPVPTLKALYRKRPQHLPPACRLLCPASPTVVPGACGHRLLCPASSRVVPGACGHRLLCPASSTVVPGACGHRLLCPASSTVVPGARGHRLLCPASSTVVAGARGVGTFTPILHMTKLRLREVSGRLEEGRSGGL